MSPNRDPETTESPSFLGAPLSIFSPAPERTSVTLKGNATPTASKADLSDLLY